MLRSIALSAIFATHLLCFQLVQDQHYTIRGRVVDSGGNPVKNALIYYGREAAEDSGGTYEGARSDVYGTFSLSIESFMKAKPLFIYVTSDIPDKAKALMHPPFPGNPRHVRARFAGPRLLLNEQKEIEIGDVMLKVTFLPVSLTVLNANNQSLAAGHWFDLVIRLLDQGGKPVEVSSLSQRDFREFVNLAKSELKLAIPEGNWQIEVSLSGFDGPFFGTSIQVSKLYNQNNKAVIKIASNRR